MTVEPVITAAESYPTKPDTMKALAACLFVLLALYAGFTSTTRPDHNFDMVGYIAAAKSFEEKDVSMLHSFTYDELRKSVSPERFKALTTGNPYRETLFKDPAAFAEQLPLYQIRPVYNGLIYLLHRIGVGIGAATHLISGAAIMGAVLMAWLVCQRHLAPPLLPTVPLFAVVFGLTDLARSSTPDALAAFAVLSAVYLYLKASDRALLAFLPLMVAVRTDLIIAVVLFLVPLLAGNVGRKSIAASFAASVALYAGITQWCANPGWQTIFHFTLLERGPYPLSAPQHVGPGDYLAAFGRGLAGALQTQEFQVYLVVVWLSLWLVFVQGRRLGIRAVASAREPQLMLVCGLHLAGHFAAFPVMWTRFFTAFYLTAVIALMAAASRWAAAAPCAPGPGRGR